MTATSDQQIAIRIVLAGGLSYETSCKRNSSLLRQIGCILTRRDGSPPFLPIQIETGATSRGVEIPVHAIVAIETDPSVIFDHRFFSDPVERAPYVRIPGFLNANENRRVMNYVVRRQADFVTSTLDTDVQDYRKSTILPTFDDLGVDLENRIEEILPELFAHFGLELPPEKILETQLTTHNDGGFLKIHNDNGSAVTSSRVLTYIYYFFREPSAFRGGQLRIYNSRIEDNFWVAADTFVDVQPENNMMLFFPSRLVHEVLPMACPSRQFADGRFTLNGWVRDPRNAGLLQSGNSEAHRSG